MISINGGKHLTADYAESHKQGGAPTQAVTFFALIADSLPRGDSRKPSFTKGAVPKLEFGNQMRQELDQPLIHHGIGNLKETRDVGAVNIIARRPILLGGAMANGVDAFHDFVEPRIYFLPGP